jgi:hypothetical protein
MDWPSPKVIDEIIITFCVSIKMFMTGLSFQGSKVPYGAQSAQGKRNTKGPMGLQTSPPPRDTPNEVDFSLDMNRIREGKETRTTIMVSFKQQLSVIPVLIPYL